MSSSEAHDHQNPEDPAFQRSTPARWRWFLVVPAFVVGAVVYDRVTSPDVSSIGIDLIAYPLAGFVAVFLPGKIAPSRQLLIALVCAFVLTAWTVGVMVTVTISWRSGESSGGGTAFALAFLLIIVVGSISALWMVRRKRTGAIAGDLPWAIGTGLLIPVASLALILVRGLLY